MPGNRVTFGSTEVPDIDAEVTDVATEEAVSESDRWGRRFSCDDVALLSTVKPSPQVDEDPACWEESPMRERRVVRRSVDLRMVRLVSRTVGTPEDKVNFGVLMGREHFAVCAKFGTDGTGPCMINRC